MDADVDLLRHTWMRGGSESTLLVVWHEDYRGTRAMVDEDATKGKALYCRLKARDELEIEIPLYRLR